RTRNPKGMRSARLGSAPAADDAFNRAGRTWLAVSRSLTPPFASPFPATLLAPRLWRPITDRRWHPAIDAARRRGRTVRGTPRTGANPSSGDRGRRGTAAAAPRAGDGCPGRRAWAGPGRGTSARARAATWRGLRRPRRRPGG